MQRIKIGQIGAEHDHAGEIMRTLKKYPEVFDLVGFAVPEGEKIAAPKQYEGVSQMSVEELLAVPGLQAVTVETYELNLTKYATMAIKRGLAVHMDKPGGSELSAFEEMISAVQENGVVFHTGYMYRYNPAVLKLKQRIENGELGEIYSVEAHMDCGHSAAKREWLGAFPGGMMFFLGCHLIDMAIFLRGFPEEIVPYNASTGIGGVTAPDYGFAVLKYPNGVSFVKSCAAEVGGYMRRQLVVTGSKGSVQLLPFEAMVDYGRTTDIYTGVRECLDTSRSWWNDGFRYTTPAFDRYAAMMKGFASYVAGEKENPFSPDYELAVYRAILLACGR
ncbi:MAG: Gfo/Idh/MocA family oxidoreductase [Clostridia bacterium]|nr:Gfo/Idh/MocA family oxidoreductase [Clostridia bacterium]